MPRQKPIFLFAFANDKQATLSLGKEEEAARKALTAPHVNDCIEYKNLGQASLDEIYRNFSQNLGRIAVFHYGGHSDDEFLNLTDTNARASSLGTLMGMEENLQLVFLNGCNNNGQVEELRKKKVKAAIIATFVKIDDNRALTFCEKFYGTLAGGAENMTIEKAFEVAKSYLENDSTESSRIHRGIGVKKEADNSGFEWALHLPDDQQIIDWFIPPPPQQPKDAEYFEEVELSKTDKNKNLLGLAFGIGRSEGILQFKPEFSEAADNFKKDSGDANYFFEFRNNLFDAFPSVLSRQLEDLFTPPGIKKGRLRLKELNEAYLTLGRLLCGISLSSLWEAAFDPVTLEPRKGFVIREEYKSDIQDFIYPSSPASTESYDYFWLIVAVNRIFNDQENKNFNPYVQELTHLFQSLDQEAMYYKAYRFMEHELRHRLLANNIAKEEVESLCDKAESYLGLLLQKCAFISRYELVTVKDVTINQPRHQSEPDFYHNQFTLKGLESSNRTNSYTPLNRETAINNNSIYLAREFKKELEPLNLSPFLIDENAFKEKSDIKLPKIHFFNGKEKDQLSYVHTEDPRNTLVIRKEASSATDDIPSWNNEEEKFVIENYTNKGGKRKKKNDLDEKNQDYKAEDLKVLFEQFKLFKKAIGI